MDITDDSIIPPSGQITSTCNFSTNVIIDGSFAESSAVSLPPSPIMDRHSEAYGSFNESILMDEANDSQAYERNFPMLSKVQNYEGARARSPELLGFSLGRGSPIQCTQSTSQDVIENNIIIIEPICSEDKIRSFFNNDLLLAKSLNNSVVNKSGIKNVRKNMSRKILIIEILDNKKIADIIKMTKLGPFSVSCRLPVSKTKCQGVIGPISLDSNISDLEQAIRSQSIDIDKVERILKGKDKTPTMYIKVSFSTEELPQYIKIGYQRFNVKLYVGTPWQCYRCQGFGHNAEHCRFKPRCLVSSGPHEFRKCDKKREGAKVIDVKCPNCKGNHTGNYGGCPFYQRAKAVEKVRAEKKISYRDAAKLFQVNSNNNQVLSSNQNVTQSSTRSNVSSVSMARNQPPSVDAGTQTETPPVTTTVESNTTPISNEELFKGIAKVIFDIFTQSQGNVNSGQAISDSFNKIFGTNLTRNDLSNSPKKNDDEGSQSETQSNQSFTSPPVKNKKRKTRTTGTGSRLLPAKNK